MPSLITTLGLRDKPDAGIILPHEHIYVDLRVGEEQESAAVMAEDVVTLMAPEILKARTAGVVALVECSPIGVGRRADFVKAVSEATDFPILVATGVYREPWIPQWVHDADEAALYGWMMDELEEEVAGTGIRAAWIKLSAGDDGLTPCETKVLRAAARAGAVTQAAIGSHTIRGRVALQQMDILEAEGYTPSRFIWVHTQAEPDFSLHLEGARRGAWLEYDGIGGSPDDETYIEHILRVLDAGFGDRLLLSHDRGWYDPAQPGGGTPQPFTYVSEVFLPKLRAAGVDDDTIHQLTCANPFRAFAR